MLLPSVLSLPSSLLFFLIACSVCSTLLTSAFGSWVFIFGETARRPKKSYLINNMANNLGNSVFAKR